MSVKEITPVVMIPMIKANVIFSFICLLLLCSIIGFLKRLKVDSALDENSTNLYMFVRLGDIRF